MNTVMLVAVAALAGVTHGSLYGESNLNHTCAIENPVLSCSANAVPSKVDSCCSETYGGQLLSTQFWDTYTGLEAQGQKLPAHAWTLHGLWPDFCNGSYTQYCDLSRQYDPAPSPNKTANGTLIPPYTGPHVGTFVAAAGKADLLAYMNTFWINQGAPNYDFWAHEFSKHGTCYSTFDLPCYGPDYVAHEDVVQFFETAITYYRRLPTYDWLAAAGITPSNTTTYSLAHIQRVLTAAYGATPYVGCSGPKFNETKAGAGSLDAGRVVLDEMWYYSNVLGRPQDARSLPINATLPNTSCATTEGAVHYYERTPSSVQGS